MVILAQTVHKKVLPNEEQRYDLLCLLCTHRTISIKFRVTWNFPVWGYARSNWLKSIVLFCSFNIVADRTFQEGGDKPGWIAYSSSKWNQCIQILSEFFCCLVLKFQFLYDQPSSSFPSFYILHYTGDESLTKWPSWKVFWHGCTADRQVLLAAHDFLHSPSASSCNPAMSCSLLTA